MAVPSPNGPPALRLVGITKRFGPLLANDAISLDLKAGEVLALLGENGAGKSTLVSILFGHYVADAGHVEAWGQRLPAGQPRAALRAGIGMVHQHFTLADNLSVLDNVMLGTEPWWRPWSRRGQAQARLAALSQQFGLAVDPQARVGTLAMGERQKVEILKALYRGARILILDEPTAVLTPGEGEQLFATLDKLIAQGLAVVFISHKLDEVLRVAHRVAVLRAGQLVAQAPAAGLDKAQLAAWMVGREVAPPQRLPAQVPTDAPVVLHAQGISMPAGAHGMGLEGVDLQVRAGEIVAIAGVSGNGQLALTRVLHGLLAPARGQVQVHGRTMPARPRAWVDLGVARIPEDRQGMGMVGELSLWENAITEGLHSRRWARWGWLKRKPAQAHAQGLIDAFDVRASHGLGTVARRLSGGNMQKLVLGRALSLRGVIASAMSGTSPTQPGEAPQAAVAPALVVAAQPTWGLDVGAVAFVHQRLMDVAAQGGAVLILSEDLDEVLGLADRVAVMHRGRLTPLRPRADWTLAALGLAMAGSTQAPVTAAPEAPPTGAR